MRGYAGVVVFIAVMYTISSQAGHFDDHRPAGGARSRNRRSSSLTEFFEWVLDAFGEVLAQPPVRLAPAGVGGLGGPWAKPWATGERPATLDDALTMARRQYRHLDNVNPTIKQLIKRIHGSAKNKTARRILNHVVYETEMIHFKHVAADNLERNVLAHVYFPTINDEARSVFKTMNTKNRSRRDKLKRLFKLLPEELPIVMSDKIAMLIKMRVEVYQREKSFFQFIANHFSGFNLMQLQDNVMQLQEALRYNYNNKPTEENLYL